MGRALMTQTDQQVEVDAPVERAWQLVSTSEGISSWFVDATVVPGGSGTVTLRFGPGFEGVMPITAWDPAHRLRFGAPPRDQEGRSHDISVLERTAGSVVVRLVDTGDDILDPELNRRTWAGMLARLKELAES